jgi:hypothetical protein
MKHVSIKFTDEEHEQLEMARGTYSKSDYIRIALAARNESANNENTDFHELFSDVTTIKEALPVLATKKDLLSFASFMAEVASIANPPAYANHREKIQQLYQSLASKMSAGG